MENCSSLSSTQEKVPGKKSLDSCWNTCSPSPCCNQQHSVGLQSDLPSSLDTSFDISSIVLREAKRQYLLLRSECIQSTYIGGKKNSTLLLVVQYSTTINPLHDRSNLGAMSVYRSLMWTTTVPGHSLG